MAKLNYATEYLQTLEQMFPYVLYFGDLFATPNNGRFRWVNSRVIEVPTISTTGRTDGDRDTIGTRKRNYNNEWKPLTLENHRQWQTLVHPRDIAETKGVVAIGNITKVYNEEQKFPEMNAYCISKLYADWTTDGAKTAHSEALTEENVLTVFDEMMKDMDNKRVPRAGRILYVTPDVRTLINNAKQIYRTVDVGSRSDAIKRAINSIDDVKIPESVPEEEPPQILEREPEHPKIFKNLPEVQEPLPEPQQLELFQEKLLAPKSRSRHKLIGQLFDTYWLVQFEDNF
mgnify:CR=1 FL=1